MIEAIDGPQAELQSMLGEIDTESLSVTSFISAALLLDDTSAAS